MENTKKFILVAMEADGYCAYAEYILHSSNGSICKFTEDINDAWLYELIDAEFDAKKLNEMHRPVQIMEVTQGAK